MIYVFNIKTWSNGVWAVWECLAKATILGYYCLLLRVDNFNNTQIIYNKFYKDWSCEQYV